MEVEFGKEKKQAPAENKSIGGKYTHPQNHEDHKKNDIENSSDGYTLNSNSEKETDFSSTSHFDNQCGRDFGSIDQEREGGTKEDIQ